MIFLRERSYGFTVESIKKIVGFSFPILTKLTTSDQHDVQISYPKLNPNLTEA